MNSGTASVDEAVVDHDVLPAQAFGVVAHGLEPIGEGAAVDRRPADHRALRAAAMTTWRNAVAADASRSRHRNVTVPGAVLGRLSVDSRQMICISITEAAVVNRLMALRNEPPSVARRSRCRAFRAAPFGEGDIDGRAWSVKRRTITVRLHSSFFIGMPGGADHRCPLFQKRLAIGVKPLEVRLERAPELSGILRR